MIVKCPADGAVLQESMKGGLPHWSCPTCQGRLVFMKTFRYALLAKGAPDIAADVAAGTESPEHKCGNCREPMKTFKLKQDGAESIDVEACPRCRWLWFEQGKEFGAKGAEREAINARFRHFEDAYRRFRYWHTFRDHGRFGFLIPWAVWTVIVALLIREHLHFRAFDVSGMGNFFDDTPFRNTVFLLAALVLTITAKLREWFIVALLLVLWAA